MNNTRITRKTAQEARDAIIETSLENSNDESEGIVNSFASKAIKDKKQKQELNKKKKKQNKLLDDIINAKDQLEGAYSTQSPSLPLTLSTSISVLPSTSASTASSLTLAPSLDLVVNRNNVSPENSLSNPISQVDTLDQTEKTAKAVMKFMLDQMKDSKFPKKLFKNGPKTFGYSAVLQFTNSKTTCARGEMIVFVCVFCGSKIKAVLGSTSNINGHFDTCHSDPFKDKEFLFWYNGYKATCPAVQNKTLITSETLKILKYFISSNTALREFDSVHFRELLSGYTIKIPCARTFSDVILTSVFAKMNKVIESKLEESLSICLISDIWTNKQMLDFMGLAVNLINKDFKKETLVIGMCLMPGNHNAENIKEAIETLVNQFNFDKSTIHGNFIVFLLRYKQIFQLNVLV